MAILSHCFNPCFTTCIFGSVYWRFFNLFPVVERLQRDDREAAERQQRERLKRDPNPGSGHIIALGMLNHSGECCQMLRTYLTNREAEQ